MRLAAVALAATMFLPCAARCAELPPALSAARAQVTSADYRLSGRLVRVDANGDRTSEDISIKAHWFPGELRMLLKVSSPRQARIHALIEMRQGGATTIRIARPGDKTPHELPFDQWSTGPLGQGFSYEDFVESYYFWPGQKDLGAGRFGTRMCQLLQSTPGAQDRTHYAEVKSWLDATSSFPVYVEKTLKGRRQVKQFTSYGLRRTEGVWSASQVEVTLQGQSGSTLLLIEHGTPRAHLASKDFSSEQLTRF
ncbi:MAG: outer membrane lipoprotein-sorting protein [Acidobacteriaceae bacterium]